MQKGRNRWSSTHQKTHGPLAFVGQSQGHLYCISEHKDTDAKESLLLFGFLSTMTLKNGFSKHDMISLVQLFRRMSSPDDGFISRCDMHMETIFSFYYVVAIHLDCNLVLAIALLIHILASRCHPFLWSIVFYMVQRKDATSGWKMRYRRFLGWKWRSGIISLHGELRCSFQWLLLLCLRVAGWGLY